VFYYLYIPMPKRRTKAKKKELMNFNISQGVFETTDPKQVWTTELKAVIYCRVSDMKQATQWHWLEGQERVCRERCQNQSPEIVVDQIFIEPWVSGAIMERKEFNKCLKYLEQQNKKYAKITHFVVSVYWPSIDPPVDGSWPPWEEWGNKDKKKELKNVFVSYRLW